MGFRIGIDVGGTKVAYGLFDEQDTLVDRLQHPTPAEADGPTLCDLMIENIAALLRRNGLGKEEVQGVGIAMPSFMRAISA